MLHSKAAPSEVSVSLTFLCVGFISYLSNPLRKINTLINSKIKEKKENQAAFKQSLGAACLGGGVSPILTIWSEQGTRVVPKGKSRSTGSRERRMEMTQNGN